MKRVEFKSWLMEVRGQNENTATSRVSNCEMIERHEGDLDVLFDEGRYDRLIERLTYTKDDERSNAPVKHSIPIGGSLYNGSATYKNAANLYREFRSAGPRPVAVGPDGVPAAPAPAVAAAVVPMQAPVSDLTAAYESQLLGGTSFLEQFDAQLKELAADALFALVIECVDSRVERVSARPTLDDTKRMIKLVFNEVEADRRFHAMGSIAEAVMSWGKRKNSAYISAYFATKILAE